MAQQTSFKHRAEKDEYRRAARALFISRDVQERFIEGATAGQLQAATRMLKDEMAHREVSKRERMLRQARFPVPKSLEDFDWGDVTFPEAWGKDDMCSLSFVDRAEDLVFFGKTGRGKTHAATALGMRAVLEGRPVRFYQTAQLVLALGKAKREGTLDKVLQDMRRAQVVILDEFGYVPFDVDGARLLYQVITECYEVRSVIFTTNIEFSRWGTVFADDKLAAAIVDRVVHHGRLVEFGGPSRRLEESLMLGRQVG
jgi:DNA replication protein DnaC